MNDTYAVMGNPIAHSKSPLIHARFARQTAQQLQYNAIEVAKGSFAQAVDLFRTNGGRGLNITVPFKEEAWRYVDRRSERAEIAGAVNTIDFRGDGCYGDNTDGVGMVRDIIVNHGGTIAGKRVMLLGAGGAVRGVLGPLLAESPAQLLIVNRTVSKARALAKHCCGPVEACGYDALGNAAADIVINGTAASLGGNVPPLPDDVLAEGAWCYDMMYGNEPTAFVRWAQTHGAAKSLDGLGMLVEQAAESFYLWRGVRPETAPVMAMLRGL
ncbi:MAG: shikimate dehydrogenase [Gammaproteobacteria bacterium]|nr:shikimate dehydrogenase [Gammaproteobacteria bacterium]